MKEIHKTAYAVNEILVLHKIIEKSTIRLASIEIKEKDGGFKNTFNAIKPKLINLQTDLSFIYASLYISHKQDVSKEHNKKFKSNARKKRTVQKGKVKRSVRVPSRRT